MTNEKRNTMVLTSIIGVVVLTVLALVLIGFLVYGKLKENGTITTSEAKEIMKNFDKYYNSKERTVIYYASTTCGWCSLQTPILETIAADYDMDYIYVDASKLGKSQIKEVTEKLGIKASTPTTVIVENKKVIDVANGFTEATAYVEFFKTNGLIPEDAIYSKEDSLSFISYSEYDKLINEPSTKIIVIGQTTCSHCIAIKPTLNEIAKENNLTINYININTVTEDEYGAFRASLTTLGYSEPSFVEKGSFGTPLTLIIKDKKIVSYIAGECSKSKLVREFKKFGLISE